MRIHTKPTAQTAHVFTTQELQENIFKIVVHLPLENGLQSIPKPGQFYMLKAVPSRVLLARPISIYTARILYHDGSEKTSIPDCAAERYPNSDSLNENDMLELSFLILQKGEGTEDLCLLKPNDSIEITGPLGNRFLKPSEHLAGAHKSRASKNPGKPSLAIIGGGIGIAPVAGFALGLAPKTYDFYASFKTGGYGLKRLEPAQLYITTDDGSNGVQGMLPKVFTLESLVQKKYTLVYACGPLPMLAYVQKICQEAGVQSWLSMEERMACGVGACLGCNIETTDGQKRVCKAGPVFSGEKLVFGGAQ